MRRATICCSSLTIVLGVGAALGYRAVPADVVITRYPSGRPETERRYRNGVLDGTSRGWYESGAPRFVLHYSRGLSDGEQRRWYPSGRLRLLFHHRAGYEVGQQQLWNPDGSIRSNYVIRGGKRYGLLGATGCTGKDRRSDDGATP